MKAPRNFRPASGRDETFYACTACHGFKLVTQQGMNRRQWDDTLNWMTTKHGMPALEGKDRELVLNYLEANLSATLRRNVAGKIRLSTGDVSHSRA